MKKFFIIFLICMIAISCEKELDFKYHDVESQLVIEGTLSTKGSVVALSYTVPMNEPLSQEYIVDAEVTLTDMINNVTYNLIPENGIFCDALSGIPDHIYELSVIHNGRIFKSKCLMRSGVEILDLRFQWIKMPYDHVAVLEINSTISKNIDTCYWTRIYKNGEPYKWLMSHGSGAINGILSQTTFTTRQNPDDSNDSDTLKDGDRLNVMIWPISLDMYDYLVGISSDSNGQQMFSGDFCLGYFLAGESAEAEIIFRPSEIPYYPYTN